MSRCEWSAYLGVIWGVVLDDPVHLWDVQAPGCHVSAQQDPRVGVAELEEGGGSLGLFLLALREEDHSRVTPLTGPCLLPLTSHTTQATHPQVDRLDVGGLSYVDGHDGQVDVVEQLIVELDRHAGGEEHHELLLPVLLQEREEQQEALLRGTHHVALGNATHTHTHSHPHTHGIRSLSKYDSA